MLQAEALRKGRGHLTMEQSTLTGFGLETLSITKLEDAAKFQPHRFLQPLRVQCLHHQDSSALKA